MNDFGLTPHEADALGLLTCGRGYDAICQRLKTCRSTLRTHLRSAYHKTRCGKRVDLILLLVHEYLKVDRRK